MTGLQNKVALVTGGAQGIGKGIARHFLGLGMRVVIADIDPEAGSETLAEYQPLGDLRFVQTDVADEASATRAVAAAIDAFGGLARLPRSAGRTAGFWPVFGARLRGRPNRKRLKSEM